MVGSLATAPSAFIRSTRSPSIHMPPNLLSATTWCQACCGPNLYAANITLGTARVAVRYACVSPGDLSALRHPRPDRCGDASRRSKGMFMPYEQSALRRIIKEGLRAEQVSCRANQPAGQSLNGSTRGACVRCPSCLQSHFPACISEPVVKIHKDCLMGVKALCTRSIYECPHTGLLFTHPALSAGDLASIYSSNAALRTERGGTGAISRSKQQLEFLMHHVQHLLATNITVVDVGCGDDYTLRNLHGHRGNATGGESRRRLMCYQPSATGGGHSQQGVTRYHTRVNAAHVGVTIETVHALFDPPVHRASFGSIDLLLMSHVLEHIADVCSFLTTLHRSMAAGGIVFVEVPLQQAAFLRKKARGWRGGFAHVTFPSERALLLLFEATGFQLGVMQRMPAHVPRGQGQLRASSSTTDGKAGDVVRAIFFRT